MKKKTNTIYLTVVFLLILSARCPFAFALSPSNDIQQHSGQSNGVKGAVVDSNGEPLVGATVVVKGSKTSTVTIQKCLFSNEACAYDDTYMFYETCLCGSATTSYSDNYLTGNRMETGRKGVGAKALNLAQEQLFEDFLSGNLTIKDKNSVIYINQIGDSRWIK